MYRSSNICIAQRFLLLIEISDWLWLNDAVKIAIEMNIKLTYNLNFIKIKSNDIYVYTIPMHVWIYACILKTYVNILYWVLI